MYAYKVKKIAAVHDLSGMGRVSLTVVIPILSSMGFQVCPLPTAVLSNHTQYPGFSFLDLTDEMPKIIAQWKKLEVEFDSNTYTRARNTTRISFRTTYLWYCTISQRITDE